MVSHLSIFIARGGELKRKEVQQTCCHVSLAMLVELKRFLEERSFRALGLAQFVGNTSHYPHFQRTGIFYVLHH